MSWPRSSRRGVIRPSRLGLRSAVAIVAVSLGANLNIHCVSDQAGQIREAAQHPSQAPPEFSADEAAEGGMIAELGSAFRVRRTAHFSIVSDCSADSVAAMSDNAEAACSGVYTLLARLRIPTRSSACKLIVLFMDRWELFAAQADAVGLPADQTAPGFFDSRANRCVLFNFANADSMRRKRLELAAARLRLKAVDAAAMSTEEQEQGRRQIGQIEAALADQERLINQIVVRHEIAHQVLYSLGIPRPGGCAGGWLVEGLAMQFESDPCWGLSSHRLEDLLSPGKGSFDLYALIAAPERWELAPGRQRQAYALAGGLVSYLIERRPQAFARFVQAAHAGSSFDGGDGPTCVAEFEAAFGRLDAAFEVEFRGYVEELKRRRG